MPYTDSDVARVIAWAQEDGAAASPTARRRLEQSVMAIQDPAGQNRKYGISRDELHAYLAAHERDLRDSVGQLLQVIDPAVEPAQAFGQFYPVNTRQNGSAPVPMMLISFDGKARRYTRSLLFPWPDGFMVALAGALESREGLLRRCKSCGHIFLRTKRQEYCQLSCSQRERSKRWYEGHRQTVLDARQSKHGSRKAPRRKPTRASRQSAG